MGLILSKASTLNPIYQELRCLSEENNRLGTT